MNTRRFVVLLVVLSIVCSGTLALQSNPTTVLAEDGKTPAAAGWKVEDGEYDSPKELEALLNRMDKEGWRFHSIELGDGLMIFEKKK